MEYLAKEKIRKTNLGLYPSTLSRAKELSKKQGRSLSNLLRWLVDSCYQQELLKENRTNAQ